jgi:hypothetical protein
MTDKELERKNLVEAIMSGWSWKMVKQKGGRLDERTMAKMAYDTVRAYDAEIASAAG